MGEIKKYCSPFIDGLCLVGKCNKVLLYNTPKVGRLIANTMENDIGQWIQVDYAGEAFKRSSLHNP